MNFRDGLSLILVASIMVFFCLQGAGFLEYTELIDGALIASFTLVVQFYFRKKEAA